MKGYLALSLLALAACDGPTNATRSGAGGSAGGDAAGTAGIGGASGGAGTVGGSGASGGTSAPASGPECRTAEDCVLVAGCCGCRAEPTDVQVAACGTDCSVDSCAALGIQWNEVTCVFGRCVLARSCVADGVSCPADVAPCPAGTVHSALGSCWGPCLPPTECGAVADCSSCPAGTVCVTDVGVAGRTIACVTPAPDCHAGSYCGCLGACPVGCAETDAGVGCFCPGC